MRHAIDLARGNGAARAAMQCPASVFVLCLLLAAGALSAQVPTLSAPDEIGLHAVTLKSQPAALAVPLVQSFLSKRGTVEVQDSHTLVIRDKMTILPRIVDELRAFDRPSWPQRLRVEILLVRASRVAVSPPYQHSDLPEDLTRKLKGHVPYDIFETQAKAALQSREGEAISYDLGGGYQVSLRLGAALPDGRIRASKFSVVRQNGKAGSAPAKLFQAHLNLLLNQTNVLGFAKDESSREALILVVTVRRTVA